MGDLWEKRREGCLEFGKRRKAKCEQNQGRGEEGDELTKSLREGSEKKERGNLAKGRGGGGESERFWLSRIPWAMTRARGSWMAGTLLVKREEWIWIEN
jgi:hypothetical protein